MADSHQRRGIGQRLLNELATLARERGICEFNATALRENAGVLAMVHNSDWPSVVRRAGSELDIVLTLPAPSAADGSVPAQPAPARAVLTVCS